MTGSSSKAPDGRQSLNRQSTNDSGLKNLGLLRRYGSVTPALIIGGVTLCCGTALEKQALAAFIDCTAAELGAPLGAAFLRR